MRWLIFITFSTLCLQLAVAQSEGLWTLDRCIQHALEHNLDIQIQQNHHRKAELSHQQSRWNLLPSINGYGNSNFDFQRSTNQFNQITSGNSYNVQYGIVGSLDLFAGFIKQNHISAQRYYALAVNEQSAYSKFSLINQITELYALTAYQKELISVLEQQIENNQNELDRVMAYINIGRVEPVLEYEIRAHLSMSQLELTRAINQYRLLNLQLAQTIHYHERDFEISGLDLLLAEPAMIHQNTDSVYMMAVNTYPLILKRELELNYYEKVLDISKGRQSPSLQLNAGYHSAFFSTDTLPNGGQTSFGTQFDNYLNPSVSVSLNIPIFNGRQKRTEINRSKIDLENAHLNLQNEKLTIKREIEEAVLKLTNLHMEYKNSLDNLKFNEKSFEIHQEKFRLGLITTNDFMNTQLQLSQAKATMLLSRYSWVVQKKTLELYMQGI
ncbi:TolC family protein [Natronoflexus pectinivorans]|uniref:Outer membrane protein TolC n=1 Tax=Natronoflexus pectinivorans TaxID=682526 RepID=A0A4R2GKJ4_9BACT|nr:TolC family protein [Natronoflexus pectinivorans]TCO09373.1 outer membrane protein TolC [Natronoflexus pectinivorans]